jgi:hypothetical protein
MTNEPKLKINPICTINGRLYCNNCGKQVSKRTRTCAKCAAPKPYPVKASRPSYLNLLDTIETDWAKENGN